MAEKLSEFDFTKSSDLTSGDKGEYHWDEWFDGDIWQLTEGVDFTTHPLMMERIIRTRATGRSARVRLRHLPLPTNGAVNKKTRKPKNPFGVIVLQRVDIVGPADQSRLDAQADTLKAERAAKRAAKKAESEAKALEHLQAAGITPVAKKTPHKVPMKRLSVVS